MVSVATTFDAPIKLVWPKALFSATTSRDTLLGLGDIVVPGTLFSSVSSLYGI